MTELQFLIDLLLKHKLPKGTRQLVADRIAQVETDLVQRPIVVPPAAIPGIQRSLRGPQPEFNPADTLAGGPTTFHISAPARPPKADIDKETGTAIVSTGAGTRGMRKF